MSSQVNLWDGLVIDNFAGGGGASTGIEFALGRQVDIAINHDRAAVAMHMANHPYTKHYCESVWEVDPRKATMGQPVALAWFSPDCKHFSKAKGGKPVKKEIRGLAWVAVRWAATVKPRVIVLENVEEFKTWGPLLGDKPDKAQSGRTFNSFVNALRRHGYVVDWRELKACDYGAPTIRKRLFLIARSDGQLITWPEPTHGAPASAAVKSGALKPYRTAAEIINWSLPCPSIFDTSAEIHKQYGVKAVRPLAEATLRRIARGLQKFVFDSPEPFIVSIGQNGFRGDDRVRSIHAPLNTTVSKAEQCLVVPTLAGVGGRAGQSRPRSADEPMATVTAKADVALISTALTKYHGEKNAREVRGQSLTVPVLTVDTSNRYGLMTAFMSKYFSGDSGCGNAPTDPLNTVTAVDHNALVTSHVIKFKGDNLGHPADQPLQTLCGCGHFGEVRAFLTKYYGNHNQNGQSAAEPVHTITAKDRLGVVTVHGSQYAIADIGLRMLTPRELFNAQGFPPDYIIDVGADGKPITKAAQVARCGNSVCPALAEAIVRANLPEMCGRKVETMAEFRRVEREAV